MPYIKEYDRERLDPIGVIQGRSAETPGELNFQITRLIHNYYCRSGSNYWAVNEVLGALEGAKLEFYRRVAAPYEDKKIEENGDVY